MAHKCKLLKIERRTVANRSLVAAAMAGFFVLAGCGDKDVQSKIDESLVIQNDLEKTEVAPVQSVRPGFKVPDGVRLADGLIPELSRIPLPSSPAVFEMGTAYTASQDPRETAVQSVHFTVSPRELLGNYLSSLPAAGFTIRTSVDAFDEASQAYIEFIDPDGLPGRIFFRPGAWSESQMRINLYQSGKTE